MCFGSGGKRYVTRASTVDRSKTYDEYVVPDNHGALQRQPGASYYPQRYYDQPPCGRYAGALTHPARLPHQDVFPAGLGYSGSRYFTSGRARMPSRSALQMEAYPRPRHQYLYTPRYGQRGFSTYAGQIPNGAPPVGVGMGIAPGGFVAAGPIYGGGNYYHGHQPLHYAPAANYTAQAYVYPPGPHAPTTTYHVCNSHAAPVAAPRAPCHHTTTAYTTCRRGPTREDIQMENRRVATERGAYSARPIQPADAREDDPFWCREWNGEWHLRTYYQIENQCYPGRWLMDAELGYLVFHRDPK